nr:unnamed protein product [Spirometra erinaceieuropaei]
MTWDGAYDLSLRYCVDPHLPVTRYDTLPLDLISKTGGDRNISFAEMAQVNDTDWKSPINPDVFLLYPQGFALREVIKNYKETGLVPKQYPHCAASFADISPGHAGAINAIRLEEAVTYWRLRRAYERRLDKLTNERADGRLKVPVAVTGRSKRELSIEESQPSTIGETNQRTRRWKTGRHDSVLRPLTLHAYLQCLWPLPAGQRKSCRMMRANHRRLEKLTNEGADGRLEVPVAVTGRSKSELSN